MAQNINDKVALSSLPKDLIDRILLINEKTGFIPNIFLELANRPDELKAFMDYHEVIEKGSGLTKIEREMIILATSSANKCPYCVVAHGAILRVRSRDPLISDKISINYRSADISGKHKVMLDFACKLAREPELVDENDKKNLISVGFSEEQIWDIGSITSFFALSNRMSHLINVRPNPEFYGMGR